MKQEEIKDFLECLGEIWRDITAIEFLMRCAIAKKEGETSKFPKPPYTKGKIYKDYPQSFSQVSFEDLINKFNQYFPKIKLPREFAELRHAMAHGVIAEISNIEIPQLIKFKELKKTRELKIEFSLILEPKRITQIRQSLREYREYIMKEADDRKK